MTQIRRCVMEILDRLHHATGEIFLFLQPICDELEIESCFSRDFDAFPQHLTFLREYLNEEDQSLLK